MKFRITMKDPDGYADSIDEAAKTAVEQATGIDEDEKEQILETKRTKLSEVARRWFEYSEYLTVEIDTEADTIAVIPCDGHD